MAADPRAPQPPEPPAWEGSWPAYGWQPGAHDPYYGGYGPWDYQPWMEPPPPPARRSRRWLAALVLVSVATAGTAAGVGIAVSRSTASPVTSSFGGGSVSGSTLQVDKALVDINSHLAGDQGIAAGTGMVIGSSGEVLTNNHVIQDGDRITAQVNGTGPEYQATVVGDDPVHDVALLQLQGVSNLPTVTFTDGSSLKVGDSVTALGNALGEGGPPVASSGSVTGLAQTITVSNDMGGNETLNNLIEMNAEIQQGDSGGPLLDSQGKVVGMVTAAEVTGPRRAPTSTAGYAIPSTDALGVVHQIQHGGGGSVQIGSPPVLGVEVTDTSSSSGGVAVSGVQAGSPADQAGISPGNLITSIDGQPVNSATQLRSTVRAHKVGDQVRVVWRDDLGQARSATLRLVAGPPA